VPSFNGVALFGAAVSMRTIDNPRGQQRNAYPGLSGLESLDQGLRGRYTIAVGRLFGDDAAALAGAEALFRSFHDGAAYTLVDNFGTLWLNVKLEGFEPQGRVQVFAGNGAYHRPYVARFEHLS
jgi:hypothetical protein